MGFVMTSNIKHVNEGGVHTFSMMFAGRELVFQSGKLAGQASGECTVRYGDTVLMATAVMSKNIREGMDYFPLMVDYDEKLYAAGKIKGSRFIKREGRPSDDAILSGRLVDRSIRPFFDQSARRDVQVVVTALSWDGENDPDTLAVIAASNALNISDIEWSGPVAAVRLNRIGDEWILNATYEQRDASTLDLLVSVRGDRAVMIEADGDEAPDELIIEGVELAIKEAQPLLEALNEIRNAIGKEKTPMMDKVSDEQEQRNAFIRELVEKRASAGIEEAFSYSDREKRSSVIDKIKDELDMELSSDPDVTREERAVAEAHLESLIKKATKDLYLNKNRRLDGRAFDEIRPLSIEVGLLPRTHGSGLFTRGETQALSVLTLGSPSDEQILDSMEENDTKKRYMHHYNFPAFSVGEVRPNRGPGRREIGHGALAEKALEHMIPDKEEFPYTIRIVSEILSSNGSSSMAATCGSTLALMDAGVPIKSPVAGIAMGILTSDENPTEDYRILTDIQGAEDHYGEMDFKITGTNKGITAIQLDVKNEGVTPKMARETILKARDARMRILEEMLAVIPSPRPELSSYAPRIYTMKIDPEKIGDVIGPRGKIINEIIDETGVAIDIEDDGLVMITSTDADAAERAREWIIDLTREVEVGEFFEGKVTRVFPFGAMVEILPGKEGLIHISELAPWRVNEVSDIVDIGDTVPVKVIEIDSEGRTNLSLKETNFEYTEEMKTKSQSNDRPQQNRNRNGRNGNTDRRSPRRDNGRNGR